MDLAKRKSLMKAFITTQLNYCPLTWMFHSGQLNNRINKIQERALRLVYKNKRIKTDIDDLLKLDDSVYYTPAKPSDTFNRNIQGKKQFSA